ncbi:MAG: sodium-dependent bicarbonate transport family permease [Pseudomonadota bacterium]
MDTTAFAPFASPVILFFLLGLLASALRSDLAIPEAMAKGMSLYLMAAIGLKGGVAVAKSGVNAEVAAALLAGIALSFAIPLLAYAVLRGFARLDQINAGAVAAHYGSVSVVTFVTANEILGAGGLVVAGFMVAVLAVMETPAILSGLMLARRGSASDRGSAGELVREVFLNASVVLLLGSFAIGLIAGPRGYAEVQPLFDSGFKGVLCLFLLDMGLIAARRLIDSRSLNLRLVILAIAFPLFNGTMGVLAGHAIGLDTASIAALGVLCASASYIAVPAAMRLALPQADPGIYLTMSLSITFPFNILVGISLFAGLARWLAVS